MLTGKRLVPRLPGGMPRAASHQSTVLPLDTAEHPAPAWLQIGAIRLIPAATARHRIPSVPPRGEK